MMGKRHDPLQGAHNSLDYRLNARQNADVLDDYFYSQTLEWSYKEFALNPTD